MKVQRIKALSTLPFIAGIIWVLRSLGYLLLGFSKVADDDSAIKSEVEVTTKDHLGSVVDRRSEVRHGTGLPGYLALALIAFSYFFYDKVSGASQYILTETPYLMLAPLFISGFIASLFKKDIKNFTKGEVIGVWSLSWHYVAGFILSFFLTYCLWILGAFELDYINAFTLIFVMLPTTIFIFVAFIAPISVSITAIITHLRIKKFRALYSPALILLILFAHILNSGYTSKLKDFGAGHFLNFVKEMSYKSANNKKDWGYRAPRELALFNGSGNNYSKAIRTIKGELKQEFDNRKEYFDEREKHSTNKKKPMSYEKFKQLKSTSGYKAYTKQKTPPKGKGSLVLEITPRNTTIKIKRSGDSKGTLFPYKSGMLLKPGYYYVTVSRDGYKAKPVTVEIKDQERALARINLKAKRR